MPSKAAEHLERAVDLLPEWVGSYSTLGVFYYQTGQIEKAREVLDRFKGSNSRGLGCGPNRGGSVQGSGEYSGSGSADSRWSPANNYFN